MFLNVCKQTFHISQVRISRKVKVVLMWNLQHIILIWRRRYWQIFKSALVYLYIHIWYTFINSFYPNAPFLYLLETSENLCFPDVFTRFRKWTFGLNRLDFQNSYHHKHFISGWPSSCRISDAYFECYL